MHFCDFQCPFIFGPGILEKHHDCWRLISLTSSVVWSPHSVKLRLERWKRDCILINMWIIIFVTIWDDSDSQSLLYKHHWGASNWVYYSVVWILNWWEDQILTSLNWFSNTPKPFCLAFVRSVSVLLMQFLAFLTLQCGGQGVVVFGSLRYEWKQSDWCYSGGSRKVSADYWWV